MSEQRPIQRYQSGAPAGQVMTAQGPAVIQVIDMPTGGLTPVPYAGSGTPRRKPGGIDVVGAVLKRWWLVLLVAGVVGGGSFFAGANLVKPAWEGRVKISYSDNNPNAVGGGIGHDLIYRLSTLMTARDIPLLAARDPELQAAFPWLRSKNLDDPAAQIEILTALKDCAAMEEAQKGTPVMEVFSLQPTAKQSAQVANAFARAVVKYCQDSVKNTSSQQLKSLQDDVDYHRQMLAALQRTRAELHSKYNFDFNGAKMAGTIKEIERLSSEMTKAQVDVAAAEAVYINAANNGKRKAAAELARIKLIEDEKGKDSVLKAYIEQQMVSIADVEKLHSSSMTDEHPSMVNAVAQKERAVRNVAKREAEIASIINTKIDSQFDLENKKGVEEAQDAMNKAKGQLDTYQKTLASLNEESKKLAMVKIQLDELERSAQEEAKRGDESSGFLNQAKLQLANTPTATFAIEEFAVPKLKEDKRIKVQAGGAVGGLFLGIVLALLIDKFDKRLRDPRDLEPLLNTPLLGTIPRIQELKRIKGDHARNLIAEEFRIIRTQVLFGNPELSHKLLAITSPQPGDGKTSLAVNLAISIAKAGRRVLLIDGDLRKPDVHRVFNIPDSPGFAELIQGSHEPGAVIRKSEVDGLEILPAGTPISRPSELLSRPEVARVLTALGELYDHIILDTAPLLPVSDTHVLAGLMDGVLVSFNAEVDRDIVTMTNDILRRSRANVIGCVMNQVKYRQSGSYQRGKNSYDSYYNSPRGARSSKDAGLATVTK